MNKEKEKPTVPAEHFVAILAVNVDNLDLDDDKFRELVRNTLPIVIYQRPDEEGDSS